MADEMEMKEKAPKEEESESEDSDDSNDDEDEEVNTDDMGADDPKLDKIMKEIEGSESEPDDVPKKGDARSR
jgi:hypothetical protein